MKKPCIGVTGSASGGFMMWQCTRLAIALTGGKALHVTAKSNDDYTQCDGFVISGGADIDPACYGQANTGSVDIDTERDQLERGIIEHALQQGKPMIGICRGAQMINIVKGGTLHQNARDIYTDFLPTTTVAGKILQRRYITIGIDGMIADIFGKSAIYVNSIHHQAIDRVGDNLCVSARDRHRIVQAIEHDGSDDTWTLGVQWHPEFMLYRRKQRAFFRALVKACECRAA